MSGIDPPTLPLAERLRDRIRSDGAITFRDWMESALYDEQAGYYVRTDLERWGREGDYRTAPERSPLFSATFADLFASLYQQLGAPSEFTIVESGAGAGNFAYVALQTLRCDHPQLFAITRYVIDERSVSAIERVRKLLAEFAERVEFRRLSEAGPTFAAGIVFANELLDAFPVHRVSARDGKLIELFVTVDEEGRFVWTEREPSTPELEEYLAISGIDLSEGQIAEINLEAAQWIREAASLFKRGYLFLVDYGAEAGELYGGPDRHKGTLRAFHHHRFAEDVLTRPGEQDLTTTIDWSTVRRVGDEIGLETVSFERQDEFLLRAGILDRLERLASEAASDAEALILRSSVRELVLPGGMSESFQVLVFRKTADAP